MPDNPEPPKPKPGPDPERLVITEDPAEALKRLLQKDEDRRPKDDEQSA